MAGEALRPAERLVRGADYLRCYRKGRRRSGRFLLLYFVTGPGPATVTAASGVRPAVPGPVGRMGLTASRKVGGAVVRNLLRRRAREIFRRSPLRDVWAGWDFVIHFQPNAARSTFAEMRTDLEGLLGKPPGAAGSGRRAAP